MIRLGVACSKKLPRQPRHRAIVVFTWLLALAFADVASADEPTTTKLAPLASVVPTAAATGVKIEALQIGFGGQYKVGFWTSVDVTLLGGSQPCQADLRIIVPDGDGVPTEIVEHNVSLPPDVKTRVRSYAKFGRPHAAVQIVFGTAGDSQPIAERTFSGEEVPSALLALQQLILEVGAPVDLIAAARFTAADTAQAAAIVHLQNPDELPDRWYGFDGVDIVLLTTAEPAIYRKLSPAIGDALDRWLKLGGRMVLSVGGGGAEALAPAAPLTRFAPGRLATTIPLRRFGALENFAGTSDRFDSGWPKAAGRPSIDTVQLADVVGHIEAYEGNRPQELPLVVRRAFGFGQLVFVAVDIDSAAFRRWSARPQFLATLLDRNATLSGETPLSSPQAQGLHLGFDDIAGQLRTALDQFPGVRITPFWLVAMLALAYVLLLFPLDYLLSRRGVGRTVWPWIRFAAIVAGATAGIWYLGRQGRESELQSNQVDVVDFDAQSGIARGATWFGLYSPSNAEYSISLNPIMPAVSAGANHEELSWLGLPGASFGGMNARSSEFELPLFDVPYRCAPESNTLGHVPLAAWSSKAFAAHWFRADVRSVDADLYENSDRLLAGTVRLANDNPGQGMDAQPRMGQLPISQSTPGQGGAAPFVLTDCRLFHDRWAYVIPRFSAENPIDVDRLDPLTAETLLTQRKYIGGVNQTTPYDRAGLKRESIVEMMMFYRLAGGHQYTGLWDRYQQFLDLSDLLPLDRAILVGVGPLAAELKIDGQSIPSTASAPHLTFYRFVLPVHSRASPSAAATGNTAAPGASHATKKP